jgi:hypothetical protein
MLNLLKLALRLELYALIRFTETPTNYKRVQSGELRERATRVKVGSYTSTVTLRVVGGKEKVSLKSETVKYGREHEGTRT